MSRSAILLGLAVALAAAAGCSVRFPQFETAREIFRPQPSVDAELREIAWELQFSGRRATVYPVNVSSRIVFGNRDDVAVVFDGNHVLAAREVLPGGREARVEATDAALVLLLDGEPLGRFPCAQWSRRVEPGERVVWSRNCGGLADAHRLEYAADGTLVAIEQPVHPDYGALRLRKLP